MLYIRKLFTQDLRDGKQIAFPKEPSYSFFSFDYLNNESDRQISFTFRAIFGQFKEFDGERINTRIYTAGSESRMDGEVKAFIRDKLKANVDDLLILKNKGTKFVDFEFMFIPKSNEYYYPIFLALSCGDNHTVCSFQETLPKDKNLQLIYYGAPGTGKSFKIKDNRNVKESEDKNLVFRTTFHPDSDYSTFVGAYKPTMKPVADHYKAVAGKDEEITYSFVPQAFLQAYVAAWNNQDESVYLIIEEINRGNCAQIFGDLFQLLDRGASGISDYPIMADRDLAKYLNGKDDNGQDVLTNKEGIKDGRLRLPKNLFIWATMNTSDQSLFPIDSAFKRRWDWEYIPIANGNKDWKIKVAGKRYDWWGFLNSINDIVEAATSSEDKKLGYYFVKADDDNNISAETFVSKVVFYLWNDVFKDYGFDWKNKEEKPVFKNEDGNELAFKTFFYPDGSVIEKTVATFLDNLLVSIEEDVEAKDPEAPVINGVHKHLRSVTFSDGTVFDTKNTKSHFQIYFETIKKIGVEKAAPLVENMGYKRIDSPLVTRVKYPGLENSRDYSYIQEGDYYFVKGGGDDTLIAILEELNKQLTEKITIYYV